MNIVVLVKSAVDEAELKADPSGHPVLKGAAMKMSSFDMNGVEEAVKQKEVNGGTVIVLTLGGADSKKAIREAMAMGGTRPSTSWPSPRTRQTLSGPRTAWRRRSSASAGWTS